MRYSNVCSGTFIERPNRFIAMVEIDGSIERCHVKNTGRCREILIKGAKVILSIASDPNRATKFDLIAVYKGSLLINIDSQAPNHVAVESVKRIIGDYDVLRPEFTYGDSRIDIYAEKNGQKYLIEVKGVTLERNGIVLFPDAPTERGLKHIKELEKAKGNGYECFVLFVVQMKGVRHFTPNYEMHNEFGLELERASSKGVNVIAFDSDVTEDSMTLGDPVEVRYDHS